MPSQRPRRRRGEGAVYQEKATGRWFAAVTYYDLEGTRRRRKRVAPTERAARERLKELLESVEPGARLGPDSTVREAMAEWLDTSKDRVRPETWAGYETQVRLHINPAIGRLRVRELRAVDVRELLRGCATTKGLSPSSVRYVRKVLSMALARAVAEGVVRRNVVSLEPGPSVPKPEVTPFTVDEVRAILEVIEGDRLEAIVTVAVAVGLRISEALGLRWSDLDLDARTLAVRLQLKREDGVFVLREPKSQAGRRVVGLPSFAAAALHRHRARQLEEQAASGRAWKNELDLVFTTPFGQPLHRRNVLRWFQAKVREAGAAEADGGPVRGLKELRHTAASLLHAQGATANDVKDTLGHSDVRVTLNVYTHLFDERKHEIASRMDHALGSGALSRGS